jgi:hypothetical protein
MYYHRAREPFRSAPTKDVSAMMWRVQVFEPFLERMRTDVSYREPVQAYCDFLHHRFNLSRAQGRDVPSAEAYINWAESGFPGYTLEEIAELHP